MVEATVIKAIVIEDDITKEPALLGVCKYQDEHINFKVPFSKEDHEYEQVVKALRDKLAEDFDIPVYRVDIKADQILKRMKYYSKQMRLKGLN